MGFNFFIFPFFIIMFACISLYGPGMHGIEYFANIRNFFSNPVKSTYMAPEPYHHKKLLKLAANFFEYFIHPYAKPHKTWSPEVWVVAGSVCTCAVYAGIVFCCTPGTHARESCKGSIISESQSEFFKFQNLRLNSFFSVFQYCFQVILGLLFYSFVFRRG